MPKKPEWIMNDRGFTLTGRHRNLFGPSCPGSGDHPVAGGYVLETEPVGPNAGQWQGGG